MNRNIIPFSVESVDPDSGLEVLALPKDVAPMNSRYDGQLIFFGKANNDKICNSNVFVIGAGAIGCEYLKNLALAGIGTGRSGKICVTDNDSIERSNLSRQFLFRNEHIGQFKSQVAATSVKKINSHLKIRALTDKVCEESSDPDNGVFNARFWGQLSCICTAVDNNKARSFLDDMSGLYRRPMIDSGTLGPIGHIESIIPLQRPRLRDGGGESDDGRKIPFCTLHFFPSNINHCIQYARDLFESLYAISAQDSNKFLEAPVFEEFVNDIEPGARPGALESLHDILILDRPSTISDCIQWARGFYQSVFVHTVQDVLHSYPEDHTEEGKPFWGGARKLPKAHGWNPENPTQSDLVYFAARLRAEEFGIDFSAVLKDQVTAQARDQVFAVYSPKKMVIEDKSKNTAADGDGEKKEKETVVELTEAEKDAKAAAEQKKREERIEHLKVILGEFHRKHNTVSGTEPMKKLVPAIFEKDDPNNGHIDFITCISNSRAATYGIPPEDAMFTKKIAGRIIPAMITTTAAVTGFASLQLFPVLLGNGEATVNHSVSLQEPELSQTTEPNPPKQRRYIEPRPIEDGKSATAPSGESLQKLQEQYSLLTDTFTSWDRFEITLPVDVEMNNVCHAFAKKYPGLEISSIVESRSSKWVYNAMLDKEQGEKFPLGMWTNNLLEKDTKQEEFCIDYVLKCTVVEELKEHFTVSESLPPLRYTVTMKKKGKH